MVVIMGTERQPISRKELQPQHVNQVHQLQPVNHPELLHRHVLLHLPRHQPVSQDHIPLLVHQPQTIHPDQDRVHHQLPDQVILLHPVQWVRRVQWAAAAAEEDK